MGFFDPYPGSPVVMYRHDDGREVPVPRSPLTDALLRNAVPPPPDVEMPAEDVPPPDVEMPAEDVPRVKMSQPRVPSPVGSVTPESRGPGAAGAVSTNIGAAPAITDVRGLSTPPGQAAATEPRAFEKALQATGQPDLGEVDAVSGAGANAVPRGTTLPGAGYVPDVTGHLAEPPPIPMTPEEEALMGHAKIAQEKATAEENAAIRYSTERQNADFLAQKQREYDMAQATKAADEYRSAVDKLAKTKIDPNRKWHDMSTGKKIGAVMFALISGFGSALKHQGDKNPALDIILGAIDRDVSLQMAERDKMAGDVGRRRDAYDQLRQLSTDREADRMGRIAVIAQKQADEFDAIGRQAASKDVAYQYLDMANSLRAAGNAAQAAAYQQQYKNELDRRTSVREDAKAAADIALKQAQADKIRSKLGGGGGGGGAAVVNGEYNSLGDVPKELQARAVRLPDGMGSGYVIASDKEAAKIAREKLSQLGPMLNSIRSSLLKVSSMPGFTEKLSSGLWEGSDIAVIKQELAQLELTAKNYYQLGAISASDMELIKQLGADPANATKLNENTWSQLQNWNDGVIANTRAALQPYGIDLRPGAYGAPPERPKVKTSDEFTDEMTGGADEPPLVEEETTVRSTDADEKAHTVKTASYAVPSRDETRALVKGIVESGKREGLDSAAISQKLGDAKKQVLLKAHQMEGRAKDADDEEKKLTKKGDKKGAEKARKRASAARGAVAKYHAQIKPIQEEINRQDSGSADAETQAKASKASEKAAGESRREAVGRNF